MSIQFNRGLWKTVEAKTLDLLNINCRFPGAKRFVITGTVPGKERTKNAPDGINIPEFVWNAIYCDSSHAEEMFKDKGWSLGHLFRQTDTHYKPLMIGTLEFLLTLLGNQVVELFDMHEYP